MNARLVIPEDQRYSTRTVNGRTYTGVPGHIVTVPDFDATVLVANGWSWLSLSGPTSMRPTAADGQYTAKAGLIFYDETLSSTVVFDGTNWRDTVSDAVV